MWHKLLRKCAISFSQMLCNVSVQFAIYVWWVEADRGVSVQVHCLCFFLLFSCVSHPWDCVWGTGSVRTAVFRLIATGRSRLLTASPSHYQFTLYTMGDQHEREGKGVRGHNCLKAKWLSTSPSGPDFSSSFIWIYCAHRGGVRSIQVKPPPPTCPPPTPHFPFLFLSDSNLPDT